MQRKTIERLKKKTWHEQSSSLHVIYLMKWRRKVACLNIRYLYYQVSYFRGSCLGAIMLCRQSSGTCTPERLYSNLPPKHYDWVSFLTAPTKQAEVDSGYKWGWEGRAQMIMCAQQKVWCPLLRMFRAHFRVVHALSIYQTIYLSIYLSI